MFMTISLLNKEQNISLEPLMKSIYFNKIESYQDEIKKFEEEDEFFGAYKQVLEKIAIEFDVYFKIENCAWKIPYVIILEKIYIKEDLNIKYIYRKARARLQRFDEISSINQTLYPFLLHALLLLDRSHLNYCLSKEFEAIINSNTFYFDNDLKHASNKDCIYRVSKSFFITQGSNFTNILLQPQEQISFEGSSWDWKGGNYDIRNGFYYLNIFPAGFLDSYAEKFINTKGSIIEPYHKYSASDKTIEGDLERFNTEQATTIGDKLFQGNYEQCFKFLEDRHNLTKIKAAISQKNGEIYNSRMNSEADDYYKRGGWKSDYFDAMTDGQLGTYDDFLESEGDIDNLENC